MIEVKWNNVTLLFPRNTPLSKLRALGGSFACLMKGKL